jgi:methionine synthase II (cobalamin-independent)
MIAATLGGIYPRREELVKGTWNFDKGLIRREDLAQLQAAATSELLDLQQKLGFTPLCDGLLTWQDQFRGLIEATSGFEVGGVTRLFETNRFYRQPILHAAPKLDYQKLRAAFPSAAKVKSGSWKAILPSPYWLTRATLDHHFKDEAKLGHALAGVLNDAAQRLAADGFQTIQFQEPALFYEKVPDVGFANELFAVAASGVRATTVGNFTNGDAARHHSFLQTVPVDVLGIDFIETLPEKIPPRLQGKKLQAQVVNGRESHLETPADVRDLVGRIQTKLKPASLFVTHTWDLEFVPAEVAVKKLEALASVLPSKKVTA